MLTFRLTGNTDTSEFKFANSWSSSSSYKWSRNSLTYSLHHAIKPNFCVRDVLRNRKISSRQIKILRSGCNVSVTTHEKIPQNFVAEFRRVPLR